MVQFKQLQTTPKKKRNETHTHGYTVQENWIPHVHTHTIKNGTDPMNLVKNQIINKKNKKTNNEIQWSRRTSLLEQ